MDISIVVKKLVRYCRTANPYDIAKRMGISVIFEELGSIKGYYNMPFGQRQIHINSSLCSSEQFFTAAHELGHAVLHPRMNTYFLFTVTYLLVDKFEFEADLFAAELIKSNDIILEYFNYLNSFKTSKE